MSVIPDSGVSVFSPKAGSPVPSMPSVDVSDVPAASSSKAGTVPASCNPSEGGVSSSFKSPATLSAPGSMIVSGSKSNSDAVSVTAAAAPSFPLSGIDSPAFSGSTGV